MISKTILVLLLAISAPIVFSASVNVKSSFIQSSKQEPIDDEGKVIMGWTVDEEKATITFEIEAEATGYIGFGISPQGSMMGADIFMAGVFPNGTSYAEDRFGIGFTEPKKDDHQDWILIEAIELLEIGKTYLRFSRALDTCDDEDYPIGTDTTRLIWALGATDDINYHGTTNRGVHSVNLLGEPMPEVDLEGTKSWNMTLDMEMPDLDTSYWCSFHKAPILDKKHHIVAFDAFLDGPLAKKHTHHFILHNCYVPKDSDKTADEIFGPYSVNEGHHGGHCYQFDSSEEEPLPIEYCQEYLYVWAKGGKMMSFPSNVGYPIGDGDNAGKQFYQMLEIHYDNPDEAKGLKFNTGVQYYFSDELRNEDAGLLQLGHDTDETLTIPGDMDDFKLVGHCHSDCSKKYMPEDGITVFNSLLHSHISGRKLKLRHFREAEELPWVDFDDHYDFDYQQNKPLKDVQLLPGDQLTVECSYNSLWNNGSVVVGGLSTREEMCQSFLWYYPRMNMTMCGSNYPFEQHLKDFGITTVHKEDRIPSSVLIIDEPEYLKGLYSESINKFNWTDEFLQFYRDSRRNAVHDGFCGNRNDIMDIKPSYPKDFVQYVPEQVCEGGTGPTTVGTGSTSPVTSPSSSTQKSSASNPHRSFTLDLVGYSLGALIYFSYNH